MGSLRHYVFESVWTTDEPIDRVWEVLKDLGSYARWWPQIKEARLVDDSEGRTHWLRARSSLPYDLIFTSTQAIVDRASGILESRLRGDLEGMTRWVVRERDGGTQATFQEDVVTNKRLLNVLAPVARPMFKANHTIMMRDGERGLRAYLGRADMPPRGDAVSSA